MNEHIKRNGWIAAVLPGCWATALPVQAASFDCAKAVTVDSNLFTLNIRDVSGVILKGCKAANDQRMRKAA